MRIYINRQKDEEIFTSYCHPVDDDLKRRDKYNKTAYFFEVSSPFRPTTSFRHIRHDVRCAEIM